MSKATQLLASSAFLGSQGGVRARVGFRRLLSDFWGPWLQPRYFHTWIELVPQDASPNLTGQSHPPLAYGIYDKIVDGTNQAVIMSQEWEYEPEQLTRFDPGFLNIELPSFNEQDLNRAVAYCLDREREALGPYSFLVAWRRHLGLNQARNCMTWVEEYVRHHNGPPDILDRVETAFAAHIQTRT